MGRTALMDYTAQNHCQTDSNYLNLEYQLSMTKISEVIEKNIASHLN